MYTKQTDLSYNLDVMSMVDAIPFETDVVPSTGANDLTFHFLPLDEEHREFIDGEPDFGIAVRLPEKLNSKRDAEIFFNAGAEYIEERPTIFLFASKDSESFGRQVTVEYGHKCVYVTMISKTLTGGAVAKLMEGLSYAMKKLDVHFEKLTAFIENKPDEDDIHEEMRFAMKSAVRLVAVKALRLLDDVDNQGPTVKYAVAKATGADQLIESKYDDLFEDDDE